MPEVHPDQARAAAALDAAAEQQDAARDAKLIESLNNCAQIDDVLRFFRFDHLPKHLKDASRPFAEMALHIYGSCPRCPQRTIALNKLLEAKDAAVRTFVK